MPTLENLITYRLTNQYLLEKAPKLTVVRDLCGVQAQFFPQAVHALRLRSNDFDEATLAEGLVKNWTVRGTVHIFAETDLPLFLHGRAGGEDIYRSSVWQGYTGGRRPDGAYRRQEDSQAESVWMLTPKRQGYFSRLVLEAIADTPKTRDELKAICLAAGMLDHESDAFFHPWGGGIRELCERGFMNYVVQETKAYTPAPRFEPIPEEDAHLEILRRYFTHFGPATLHDAMYWLGAPAKDIRIRMEHLPLSVLELDGRTYYFMETGHTYADKSIPPCILLAGFDQFLLGYRKTENPILPPEYLRGIFNLAGIVNPAILLRGRVVGKWHKKQGKLTFTLFESLAMSDRRWILGSAEALWDDIRTVAWS